MISQKINFFGETMSQIPVSLSLYTANEILMPYARVRMSGMTQDEENKLKNLQHEKLLLQTEYNFFGQINNKVMCTLMDYHLGILVVGAHTLGNLSDIFNMFRSLCQRN